MAEDIFRLVGEIPCPEVVRVVLGWELKNSRKWPCFLHDDETPSLHVYDDGWKCFSCGEFGDAADLVAGVMKINTLDAARMIAKYFDIPVKDGPLTEQERRELAQARERKRQEKQLREAFEKWTRETATHARIMAESIRRQLEGDGLEIDEGVLPLVHELPKFELWADLLTTGTLDEKIELHRNEEFRRWFRGSTG